VCLAEVTRVVQQLRAGLARSVLSVLARPTADLLSLLVRALAERALDDLTRLNIQGRNDIAARLARLNLRSVDHRGRRNERNHQHEVASQTVSKGSHGSPPSFHGFRQSVVRECPRLSFPCAAPREGSLAAIRSGIKDQNVWKGTDPS